MNLLSLLHFVWDLFNYSGLHEEPPQSWEALSSQLPKGKNKRKGQKETEGQRKHSEETEYKIHMTAPVILNANAGCVFAGVTHCFFY